MWVSAAIIAAIINFFMVVFLSALPPSAPGGHPTVDALKCKGVSAHSVNLLYSSHSLEYGQLPQLSSYFGHSLTNIFSSSSFLVMNLFLLFFFI